MGSGESIRRYNVVMSAAHSLLYARVETVLAGEISDGDLKVGDQLPTEDSLIARFGVSRITVRRAIQNLVTRGLVEIRRGRGTFVAPPKITQDIKELSGFVEDMHALVRKPTCADKRRARRQNSSRAPGRRLSPLLRRDLPALGDRQEDHHQQSEGRAHIFAPNTIFR